MTALVVKSILSSFFYVDKLIVLFLPCTPVGASMSQVQLIYAKQECHGETAAIADCRPTQQLCATCEELLRHGLKANWFGLESSFWPLVLKISRKQAIEFISR